MDKKRTLTYVWQALVIIVTVSAVIILSTLEGAWFNSISKGSVDTKEYSSAEIAKILSENSEDFDKAYDTVFSSEKLFENFNYERRIIAYSLSDQLKHYEFEKSDRNVLKQVFKEYGMRSISIQGDKDEPLLICISFDDGQGDYIKVIRIADGKEKTCKDYYAETSDAYKCAQYGNWYLLTPNVGGNAQ